MIYNVTIFGIDIKLNPVAFTLGKNGWEIYWYGIIIALGFLCAIIYGTRNAKRFSLDNDRMLDVVLITTPLAILCARAYYIIFDPASSFKDFFNFSGSSGFSGLAIYGGVIGAFVFGLLMCYIRKVKILDMFDLAALGFLIGQGIGRWGNFINQEAYGTFTNSSWWGMRSERTILEMGSTKLVHPCFLYESIWCLAGFILLHNLSKKRKFSGQIVLMYGIWYGFGRAFIELLRTDSLMLGVFRVSSLLSFALCGVCFVLLFAYLKKSNEVVHETEYKDMFEDETKAVCEETQEVLEEEITEEINDEITTKGEEEENE